MLENVNVIISETKFEDLRQKQRSPFKRKCLQFMGLLTKMDQEEFESEVKLLYKCCLRGVKDLHELHLRRKLGIEILEDLILRAKPEYLTIPHVIHIMWSIMSCIHHFQLRIRTEVPGITSRSKKGQAQAIYCMEVYTKFLKLIEESKQRIALISILTFYKEGKLWEVEFGCTDMITRLFQLRHFVEGIDDFFVTIEYCSVTNVEEAKYITQLLYYIIKNLKWTSIPDYILEKFLNMLECSISPGEQCMFNYAPLRDSLETCMRNLINNLGSKDLIKLIFLTVKKMIETLDHDKIIKCFGNICIHAARLFKIKSVKVPLAKGPLPISFKLFKSQKPTVILIGLKIWQHLVDRNGNGKHFSSPKIFFRECDFNITSKICNVQDKAFFKKVKHVIYVMSMRGFLCCENRIGLEKTYESVALTLVDIPCGYTASCFVTVAMSLQEYALQLNSIDPVRSHHLHATVMSILSLICYIHKAEVFYTYVLTIMEKRAEWAPHLNPPLKTNYQYAQHHILWNKPDLFFEDWETRYGLWKCFRGKKILSRK